MTTKVISASLPVADQDVAVRFYVDVLGFEVRTDAEALPGARLVEVTPPGSDVGLVLLPHDSDIPLAVRLGTPDADAALARLRRAGATLHNDEVLHLDGAPPMFYFADPDGNGLVYLQEDAAVTKTMIAVAGSLRVDPQDRNRYVEAFQDLVRRARRADGCVDVSITADSVEPGRVNNYELWESQATLDAWRAVADPPDTGIDILSVDMSEYVIARSREPFARN